MRYTIDNNLVD